MKILYLKIKKISIILLLFVFLLQTNILTIRADDGKQGICGTHLEWRLDEEGFLAISGEGEMFDYGWGEDDAPWKEYRNDIKTIKFELGVAKIGKYAFVNCRNLKSVIIPDSVTTIGESAFASCKSLPRIVIPDSVERIDSGAFSECDGIVRMIIPDSVKSMGDRLFANCEKLKFVKIPENTTKIGSGMFISCRNLEEVNVPKSVTTIESRAFANCESLSYINLHENITEIGVSAFHNCINLENLRIPLKLKEIEKAAFRQCRSLESVIIPKNITKINVEAFQYCNNLKEVVISQGVKTIGEGAFYGCDSLERVIIPRSVTNIGDDAFYLCDNIFQVFYEGDEIDWYNILLGTRNSNIDIIDIEYEYSFEDPTIGDNNEVEFSNINDDKRQIILKIGSKTAKVYGETKTNDVAPRIVNNRTMLPARFVTENLGADVTWSADVPDMVLINKENINIIIYIGSDIAYVNGEKIVLDSPAFIENNRTYAPIRFISESLGANVEWIEDAKEVIITKQQ